ncbi:MAG: acylphosphatase [Candidatus Cloacimonetes bacterium]|nr:acylphosphatase [Candidatus Cloacimonadota bacterium]
METLEIFVSGRVQGVSYRYFVLKNAIDRGISGYVRNLVDGRVTVIARGDKEKLREFLKILQQGPPLSRVNKIEFEQISDREKFTGFRIEY